jgi:hypothetical protein
MPLLRRWRQTPNDRGNAVTTAILVVAAAAVLVALLALVLRDTHPSQLVNTPEPPTTTEIKDADFQPVRGEPTGKQALQPLRDAVARAKAGSDTAPSDADYLAADETINSVGRFKDIPRSQKLQVWQPTSPEGTARGLRVYTTGGQVVLVTSPLSGKRHAYLTVKHGSAKQLADEELPSDIATEFKSAKLGHPVTFSPRLGPILEGFIGYDRG